MGTVSNRSDMEPAMGKTGLIAPSFMSEEAKCKSRMGSKHLYPINSFRVKNVKSPLEALQVFVRTFECVNGMSIKMSTFRGDEITIHCPCMTKTIKLKQNENEKTTYDFYIASKEHSRTAESHLIRRTAISNDQETQRGTLGQNFIWLHPSDIVTEHHSDSQHLRHGLFDIVSNPYPSAADSSSNIDSLEHQEPCFQCSVCRHSFSLRTRARAVSDRCHHVMCIPCSQLYLTDELNRITSFKRDFLLTSGRCADCGQCGCWTHSMTQQYLPYGQRIFGYHVAQGPAPCFYKRAITNKQLWRSLITSAGAPIDEGGALLQQYREKTPGLLPTTVMECLDNSHGLIDRQAPRMEGNSQSGVVASTYRSSQHQFLPCSDREVGAATRGADNTGLISLSLDSDVKTKLRMGSRHTTSIKPFQVMNASSATEAFDFFTERFECKHKHPFVHTTTGKRNGALSFHCPCMTKTIKVKENNESTTFEFCVAAKDVDAATSHIILKPAYQRMKELGSASNDIQQHIRPFGINPKDVIASSRSRTLSQGFLVAPETQDVPFADKEEEILVGDEPSFECHICCSTFPSWTRARAVSDSCSHAMCIPCAQRSLSKQVYESSGSDLSYVVKAGKCSFCNTYGDWKHSTTQQCLPYGHRIYGFHVVGSDVESDHPVANATLAITSRSLWRALSTPDEVRDQKSFERLHRYFESVDQLLKAPVSRLWILPQPSEPFPVQQQQSGSSDVPGNSTSSVDGAVPTPEFRGTPSVAAVSNPGTTFLSPTPGNTPRGSSRRAPPLQDTRPPRWKYPRCSLQTLPEVV